MIYCARNPKPTTKPLISLLRKIVGNIKFGNKFTSLNWEESFTVPHNAKSSGIRQKGESQNAWFKKAKHTKISEKQTFLTL